MAKGEVTGEEHVGMIELGERPLPELHRKYVWHSTRVRDLLELLYRGYSSGTILPSIACKPVTTGIVN